MKKLLLLFILLTGLVSWGQEYDIYLNSFYPLDQTKSIQKYTYTFPQNVNSLKITLDPGVVPDAIYMKYGDQEYWSGFRGKSWDTKFKYQYAPQILNALKTDGYVFGTNTYRSFLTELVFLNQKSDLLGKIKNEVSKNGGNPSVVDTLFNGYNTAERILKKFKKLSGKNKEYKTLKTFENQNGTFEKTFTKDSNESEFILIVFSPLDNTIFDVVINTCETCKDPVKDISELEINNSKLLLNGTSFNGIVTETFEQGQIKSEKVVKKGMITSEVVYHKDNSYKSNLSLYRNIEEINSKTKELQVMNDQIDKSLEEEKNQLGIRDNIKENEIGNKFDNYQEKYNEGNLKGKKLELFKSYLNYKKKHEEISEINKKDKKSRDELKNSLIKEKKKPFYEPKLKETYIYLNGVKSGIHKEYDKNDKLVLEDEYKGGVRNGSFKRYDNEVIKEVGTYVDDKKNSVWTLYSYNGKEEITYSNDKKEGEYKKYNGDVVTISGTYSYDQKQGDWKEFTHYNGNLTLESVYLNDTLNGPYKKYNGGAEAKVVDEGEYSNGLMTGEWIFRYNEINIKAEGKYVNGDGGNKGTTGMPINGREGKWVIYHENGNKDQVGSYVNGISEGEFVWYHENGNKKQVGSYVNGISEGEFVWYHENGNKKEVRSYVNGILEGKFYVYHENGNKKYVRTYVNGILEGPWTEFHENGNIKTKTDMKNGTNIFEGSIQLDHDLKGLIEEKWEHKNGEWSEYLTDEEILSRFWETDKKIKDLMQSISANNNNSESTSNRTSSSSSSSSCKTTVYICDDCSKMQTTSSSYSPNDRTTCPEPRLQGISSSFHDGKHAYAKIGSCGSSKYHCNGCGNSISISSFANKGTCGAKGNNCCRHNWIRD